MLLYVFIMQHVKKCWPSHHVLREVPDWRCCRSNGPVSPSLKLSLFIQMVLSLNHQYFHLLFKWSCLSTIKTFNVYSKVLSLLHQNFHFLLFKWSYLSIINPFTFFSNGPASASQKHSLSIQMVLPLHYQNFHFLNAVLFFHYLPGILRYWHLHWKRDVCWFLKSNT